MPLTGNRNLILLSTGTIAAAASNQLGNVEYGVRGMTLLTCQAKFLYGAGGTTVKAWVQTTFDGATWVDVMNFAFTTAAATKISSVRWNIAVAAVYVPTDGTLADDTIKDGLLGIALRARWTSTGIYSGATSLVIHAVTKGDF